MKRRKCIIAVIMSLFMSLVGMTQIYAATVEVSQSGVVYGSVEYQKNIHKLAIVTISKKNDKGLNKYNSQLTTYVNLKSENGYRYNTYTANAYTTQTSDAIINRNFPVDTVICVNVSGYIGSKNFSFTY